MKEIRKLLEMDFTCAFLPDLDVPDFVLSPEAGCPL